MEYPFKDLLPLDEVLEREGYYKDWTHLDPKVFYSLTQISEYIKTKGYGVDVRLLIAQLAEHFGLQTTQVVDLANEILNVSNDLTDRFNQQIGALTEDSEVIDARGGKTTLGQRLDETTSQLTQNANELNSQWVNILYPPAPFVPAVGDGVTDNTNTLNSLINYAIENNRKFYIPKGIYAHTGLNIKGRIEMFGEHERESILLYTGVTTGTAFKIGDNAEDNYNNSKTVFYSKFSNFKIKASTKAQVGLEATRLSHSKIEHIQVDNFSVGVSIHGYLNDPTPYRAVYNNRYTNISSTNCDVGFEVQGVISDSYFKECHVEYPTEYGFHFKNPDNQASWNVFIENCTVVGSKDNGVKKAVYIDEAILRNFVIDGNNIENFTEHGIYQTPTTSANVLYSPKIMNNGFFPISGGNAVACIELSNSYSHDIRDNVFFGSGTQNDILLTASVLSGFSYNNAAINREAKIIIESTTNVNMEYVYTAKQRTTQFKQGVSAFTGDFVVLENGKGLVVKSPDGTMWRIRVTDTGEFFAAPI